MIDSDRSEKVRSIMDDLVIQDGYESHAEYFRSLAKAKDKYGISVAWLNPEDRSPVISSQGAQVVCLTDMEDVTSTEGNYRFRKPSEFPLVLLQFSNERIAQIIISGVSGSAEPQAQAAAVAYDSKMAVILVITAELYMQEWVDAFRHIFKGSVPEIIEVRVKDHKVHRPQF